MEPSAWINTGTLEVTGGMGIPLVITGVPTTTLVVSPGIVGPTAVKLTITLVVAPAGSGPTLFQVSHPAFTVSGVDVALAYCNIDASKVSSRETISMTASPLLLTARLKLTVWPILIGLFAGASNVFNMVIEGDCALWGAELVAGGTGTLLVVVGAVTATLVSTPLETTMNQEVMVVDCPTPKGPIFVQLIVPSLTLSTEAGTDPW